MWAALAVWGRLATFGATAIVITVGRAVTNLPWPWLVLVSIGVVSLGVSAFLSWKAHAGFDLRPYNHGELLRIEVLNTGATAEFEATMLKVYARGHELLPYPQWQIPWSDEPGRRCEIPHGARHDLAIGHAAGNQPNERHDRYYGNVEFFRPPSGDAPPLNASVGWDGGDELRIRAQVTRVKPARSVERSYSIHFAPAPTTLPQHAGAVWPVFRELDAEASSLVT